MTSNPLNPAVSEGIRRFGFRKWHERELLSSQAHLALALVSVVALMASFEAFKGGNWGEKLMDTAFVLICVWVTLWSLRRYPSLLMHAEDMASQANCGQCKSYGLLLLQSSVHPPAATASPTRLVPVCCKRCGFCWNMEDA